MEPLSLKYMLKLSILTTCLSHLIHILNLKSTLFTLSLMNRKATHNSFVFIQKKLNTNFILNQTLHKLFLSQINLLFLELSQALKMNLSFLSLHIHLSLVASTPPLIFSKFTTLLILNPIVAAIIQNITHSSAILSLGYIGLIEVPAANNKPPHHKVNDVNSLIHTSFTHTASISLNQNPCSSFFSRKN